MKEENDAVRIDIDVTRTEIPGVEFKLTRAVPADSLLRIRASGVSMLHELEVTGVFIGDDDTALEFVHRFARKEMENDWNWHIQTLSLAVVRIPADIPEGATIRVKAGFAMTNKNADKGGPLGEHPRYSGITWRMACGMIDDVRAVEFKSVAPTYDIVMNAGPSQRIEAFLKSDGRLMVEHFDESGNPASVDRATITALVDGKKIEIEDPTGLDAATVTLPVESLKASRVEVTDSKGRSTKANAFPEALDGTPVFFGEFHWHTDFSGDGQRVMSDALKSSRDQLCMDFAGPADHLCVSDRYSGGTVQDQADICRKFDEPGRFCTLPGSELSRRYGHTNIYTDSFDTLIEITSEFREKLAPVWAKDPDRYGLEALIELCSPGKTLIVPHHTNMDSSVQENVIHPDGRPYWCAMSWPIPADRRFVRLIEIVQSRGCFESEKQDPEWRIEYAGFGGSAMTALFKGYRLGFVAGTDNHCGWPTRSGSKYCGITAVQSDRLDTAGIFQALHARRCYATSGARIVADATLNGHPMGSEISLEPANERRFRIRVNGTAPLLNVQVIHFGYVIADLPIQKGSWDFDDEWVDDRPGRALEDAWYYVRVRQADGHCAWLSPFWVDLG